MSPLQDAALGAKEAFENNAEEAGGEAGGLGGAWETHGVTAGLGAGWLRRRCGRPQMVNTDACVVGDVV